MNNGLSKRTLFNMFISTTSLKMYEFKLLIQ